MRTEFRPVTPTQECLAHFSKLTEDLSDDEIREILNENKSCGDGFKGWWKGFRIRMAYENLEYYRSLARN